MLQGGVVMYKTGDGYVWSVPKIYTGGQWKILTPYIYNGGAWKIAGEAGCPMVTLITSDSKDFVDSNSLVFSTRAM